MEKIGLLEDINKGNSNPDVKQREREIRADAQGCQISWWGWVGRRKRKLQEKQVSGMISTYVYYVTKFTFTTSSLYLTSSSKTIFNSHAMKKLGGRDC